jgi:glycosyltransferase involved in cell wall biosynthesis
MKFLYLISSRYPTEKAYGVTIGNTLQSFKRYGHISEILVWGEAKPDVYGSKIVSIARRPLRLPLFLYDTLFPKIPKIVFTANQIIYGFYFLKSSYRAVPGSVIWTREPLLLIPHALLCKNARYLIELHHPASKFSQKVINFLSKRNRVEIIVLNNKSQSYHSGQFKNVSISIIPMGVPNSFFLTESKHSSDPVIVGYLGKGISSGHDNELLEVIHAAKKLDSTVGFQFKFIGLEASYKEKLKSLASQLEINPSTIIFVDHVEHIDIPSELGTIDIGLLPYGDSAYNSERFPIKVLEYAAAGIPIIATGTLAHRELLDEGFTRFYSKNNSDDLADAIIDVGNRVKQSKQMSETARQFASKFTYDERVRKLLVILEPAAKNFN